MQNRNRVTDIENKLVVTKGERKWGREKEIKSLALTYTHYYLSTLYMSVRLLHLCPTLRWYPPGFSVHGILQVRVLEWVVIPFSRGSF